MITFILCLLGLAALCAMAFVAGVTSGMLASYDKIKGAKGEPAAKEFMKILKNKTE